MDSYLLFNLFFIALLIGSAIRLAIKFKREGRFNPIDDKVRISFAFYVSVVIGLLSTTGEYPPTEAYKIFSIWTALVGGVIMTIVAIYGLTRKVHTVKFAIAKYLIVITVAIDLVIDRLWWFAKEGPYKDTLFSILIVITALLIICIILYLIVSYWDGISFSWANDKTLFNSMCFVFIIALAASNVGAVLAFGFWRRIIVCSGIAMQVLLIIASIYGASTKEHFFSNTALKYVFLIIVCILSIVEQIWFFTTVDLPEI